MLNLLSFFEDSTGTQTQTTQGGFDWWLIAILGGLIVVMVVYSVLSSRRRKKQAKEMESNLTVGATITTIGGIVGEVVQLDDQHVWISTGTEDNKTTMQFVRQAIHSIAPAGTEAPKAEESETDEVDEIK